MDDQLKARIQSLLKEHKIILFMKGSPEMPMCGFSAKTSAILQSYQLPFQTFDILQDESIRQGLKEYSEWPTYPQLYVNGDLVGGCDIVVELHESGELDKILKATTPTS